MLQPDLLFSYGLSSGLAIAAGKRLKDEKSPWANGYFAAAMFWLSAFYLPQILYLLWRFPAWESMFVIKSLADIPSWFMLAYPFAVIFLGALGFYVTSLLLCSGRNRAAAAQVAWSMGLATLVIFVGWDGEGWRRLLYAGTGAEWAAGLEYPVTDFFKSSVSMTLLWLEGLVLAPYAILFIKWAREGRPSRSRALPAEGSA